MSKHIFVPTINHRTPKSSYSLGHSNIVRVKKDDFSRKEAIAEIKRIMKKRKLKPVGNISCTAKFWFHKCL